MLNPCPVKSVVVTSRQNVLKRGSVVLEDCLCTIKLEKNTADQIWNKILLLQSLTMLHLSLQMFSIRLVFSCTLKMFLWKVFMSRRLLWVLFHCEARVVEALALGKYLFKVELSLLMQCWIVWWKIAHHVFYFNTACFERALAPYKSAPNGEPEFRLTNCVDFDFSLPNWHEMWRAFVQPTCLKKENSSWRDTHTHTNTYTHMHTRTHTFFPRHLSPLYCRFTPHQNISRQWGAHYGCHWATCPPRG